MKDWMSSVRLAATKLHRNRKAWIGWPQRPGDPIPVRVVEQNWPGEPRYTDYLVDQDADGTIYFAKQSPADEMSDDMSGEGESEVYGVTRLGAGQLPECTCAARTAGGRQCKHILIAQHMRETRAFERTRVVLPRMAATS